MKTVVYTLFDILFLSTLCLPAQASMTDGPASAVYNAVLREIQSQTFTCDGGTSYSSKQVTVKGMRLDLLNVDYGQHEGAELHPFTFSFGTTEFGEVPGNTLRVGKKSIVIQTSLRHDKPSADIQANPFLGDSITDLTITLSSDQEHIEGLEFNVAEFQELDSWTHPREEWVWYLAVTCKPTY